MPSGNSVAANASLRLFHITQEEQFHKITEKILESQATLAAENPFAFGYLLNVLHFAIEKPTEITILNTENHDLIDKLNKKFIPESIMVQIDTKDKLDALSKLSFFKGKEFPESETNVFVCKNFSCSLPLISLSEIE